MKKKILSILTLTSFFLYVYPTVVSAQYDWNNVVDQAVLSWGETDEWDDGQAWNPAVIRDGDTLRMYYTGGDEIVWESANTSIGYAWSLDGIEWTRHPSNPVLVPINGWYLFGCAVIKDEAIYKMWYGRAINPGAPSFKIGYATSDDGINWTKHSSSVLTVGSNHEWDDSNITPQTVIKEGDEYKMWYWAAQPGFPFQESMPQTGMATSPDGINWTKYDDPATTEAPFAYSDPVLKVGNDGAWDIHRAISPMVRKKTWGYEMWYVGATWAAGNHDIGYAHSNDGIHWVKHPDPVYSGPNWGNTNYGGTVLAYNNEYHLWYALFHSNGPENQARPRVGYATSSNPNGVESQSMKTNVQLYPNPFSNSTSIHYEITQAEKVTLIIFDQLGKQIELIEQHQTIGKQQITWDAQKYQAGIYYYRLEIGNQVATGKLVKTN